MHKNFSEDTAIKIDEEIKRIVDECYLRAITILRDNEDILHSLSKFLIEKENLTGAEVDDIIEGKEPDFPEKEPEKPKQENNTAEDQAKPLDVQA